MHSTKLGRLVGIAKNSTKGVDEESDRKGQQSQLERSYRHREL